MYRSFVTFAVEDIQTFKYKMLNWLNRFNIFCLLDNNNYDLPYHSHECIVGAGCIKYLEDGPQFFSDLKSFYKETDDWIFGHFNYDLKNKIEELQSTNLDNIGFADAFLFIPQIVLQLKPGAVSIGTVDSAAEAIFNEILSEHFSETSIPSILFTPRISKQQYIEIVNQLKEHIKRGDCYEINFCQEFFAENVVASPASIYRKLTTVSPNPFSAFYRLHDKYLICSSPERYIKKVQNTIISQPIKGTSKRDLQDDVNDQNLKQQLQSSGKDKSENVMIVDLVRNDLSKICKEGSVQVKNLYDVQTFPYVHQMVSTIVGELRQEIDLADVLAATFPMGSMTGAPKKRVMQLIEQYEQTKRGIYSGTIGYITPDKDFDFNVVIRSLMYNLSNQYLSYQVGGAITYTSVPEDEYLECLTKAEGIKKAL